MNHAREPLFHFFRELVGIFGRNGAETILVVAAIAILLVVVVVALMLNQLLKFGEVTFHSMIQRVPEVFRLIWYHPRQSSPAIRLELYFDAAFLLIALLSLATMAAHALLPWVTEHAEKDFFYAFVSALVLFTFFGYQSLRLASLLQPPPSTRGRTGRSPIFSGADVESH